MPNLSELEKQKAFTVEQLQNVIETSNIIKLNDTESIHYDGRHYDLIYGNCFVFSNLVGWDVSLLSDLASQSGKSVLALCCGNGRIAIPLTEQGFQVTGIDISDSMLQEGRKRSEQVEWLKADVRDFDLKKKFSLIILPLNSINHILSLADLEACFNCVKNHLEPEGRFVIDMTNDYTKENLEAFWSNSRSLVSVYPDPDSKGTVVVTSLAEFDSVEQTGKLKMFFKLLGQEKEFLEEFKFRVYHPNELEMLLKFCGLTIERKLGNYEQEPFTSLSPNHIIISKLCK